MAEITRPAWRTAPCHWLMVFVSVITCAISDRRVVVCRRFEGPSSSSGESHPGPTNDTSWLCRSHRRRSSVEAKSFSLVASRSCFKSGLFRFHVGCNWIQVVWRIIHGFNMNLSVYEIRGFFFLLRVFCFTINQIDWKRAEGSTGFTFSTSCEIEPIFYDWALYWFSVLTRFAYRTNLFVQNENLKISKSNRYHMIGTSFFID